MDKAYDKQEWEFIKVIFAKLGFHSRWIRWVRECIFNVIYSLLINDSSKDKNQPSKVIKQGDPPSPYIFINWVKFLGR